MWDVPIVGYAPALLSLACVVSLLRYRPKILKTTLIGPWCWLVVLVLGLGGASLLEAIQAAPAAKTTHYLLAVSSFCPLMALLGARRPQDRGWVFVVIVFWLILALPALQVWVLGGGSRVDPAAARSWLMLLLLGVALGSGLATSRWLASLLVVAGQWMMVAPFLTSLGYPIAHAAFWGRLSFLGGLLMALHWPVRTGNGTSRIDLVWRAFRDQFGGLWALRIAERMNAYLSGPAPMQESTLSSDAPTPPQHTDEANSIDPSTTSETPSHPGGLRLRMSGLRDRAGRPASDQAANEDVWRAFRNLLRRYVDEDWIDAHRDRNFH